MENEKMPNLVVRVTLEEMEALKKAADDSGLNVSQYCRALIFKRKIKNPKKISMNEFTE